MESNHQTKSTILLVDDDPKSLGLLSEYLSDRFEILVSQDAESALLQAENEQPDIILLDVLMPGINGFETCRRLKTRETTQDIPVIFITALTDTADKVKGFKAGGVDYITKPLQPEEVLARVNAHLTIRKQQQYIQKQNEQLRELNASKDKFFSIIAHDLKNPLVVFYEFIRLFTEHIDQYSRNDIKNLVNSVRDTTETLSALLENLLIWSRIQQGMLKYCPTEIDLHQITAWNVRLLMSKAKQKKITLKNLVRKDIYIYADLNMVDTVIRNLISNALKFTEAGDMVEILTTYNEDIVTVAVSDTGIGIPEEKLSDLFRIDAKCQRKGTAGEKGTGLGLILCKEFIEKNGGKIWVESAVGKGSTFTFTLPIPEER